MITDDLMIKGTSLYRVDENGNESYIRELGLSAMPTGTVTETEKYYVERKSDGYSYGYSYVYYDKNLNYVTTISVPRYYGSEFTGAGYVMNNGNLLVQTSKPLATDAKKYDFVLENKDKMQGIENFSINVLIFSLPKLITFTCLLILYFYVLAKDI